MISAQPSTEPQMAPVDTPSFAWPVDTPIGRLAVIERDGSIARLWWNTGSTGFAEICETPVLKEAVAQLTAYFDGELQEFNLPLKLSTNEFKRQVQEAMLAIPYGKTCTYGDIAGDLGTYGQLIGQACGSNGIPIIVPCHRVLAANGVGGYSGKGGIEMKILLLKHDGGYPFLV